MFMIPVGGLNIFIMSLTWVIQQRSTCRGKKMLPCKVEANDSYSHPRFLSMAEVASESVGSRGSPRDRHFEVSHRPDYPTQPVIKFLSPESVQNHYVLIIRILDHDKPSLITKHQHIYIYIYVFKYFMNSNNGENIIVIVIEIYSG